MLQLITPIYNLVRKLLSPLIRPAATLYRDYTPFRHPYPGEIVTNDAWYWHTRCHWPELTLVNDGTLHTIAEVTGAGVLYALVAGWIDESGVVPPPGESPAFRVKLTIDGMVIDRTFANEIDSGNYAAMVGFDAGENGCVLPENLPFYTSLKIEVQTGYAGAFKVFCGYRTAA